MLCEGKGLLRYKFKPEAISSKNMSRLRQLQVVWRYRCLVWMPMQPPTNKASQLATAFSALMTTADPKYNLNCFGDWFTSMPSRFGADNVLDAAAEAFLEGLMGIWTRSGEQTVGTMTKYGHALRSLRSVLDDPVKVKSPNTLCATILFTVSRVLSSFQGKGEEEKKKYC